MMHRQTVFRQCLFAGVILMLAACRPEERTPQVAGWMLSDPAQRHPILVSQQPETLTIAVPRGSSGLMPAQRADLVSFARGARASDAGNSRIVIEVPAGTLNETAAMAAVHAIGDLLIAEGIPETALAIQTVRGASAKSPPVRVTYMRFVAEAPECGRWPTNLAREPQNLPQPNLGCANQRNLAAMVANPADLVMPRGMTARPSERRQVTWDKYVKGQSTGAEKSNQEMISTSGDDSESEASTCVLRTRN